MTIIITVFFALAGPGIVQQSRVLARQLPTLIDNVGSGQVAQQIGSRQRWSYETKVRLQEFLTGHKESITRVMQAGRGPAARTCRAIIVAFANSLFAVFILRGKAEFARMLVAFLEHRYDRRF